MTVAGILDGDLLVVDRAREARHGQYVVAVIDNELSDRLVVGLSK